MASASGNSTGGFDSAPLTGESNGPFTRTALWTLASISGVFLALRIYCKFLKSRGLWLDDYVLVAAWVPMLIDVILTTYNISLGDGMHFAEIDPANRAAVALNSLVIGSFSILAAVWSKTSFGMTLLRIAGGRVKVVVWFCILTMNLLMSANVLVLWFQCNPVEKGWNPLVPGECWDRRVNAYYGVFSGVYSGVMDIILALLPWTILWNLQMKKKEKIGVALAMSMGVFAGSTAFVKSHYVLLLLGGDFTFDGWRLAVWGTCEVAVTIVAASIPVLRVLIKEVKSTATRRLGSRGDHSFHSKSFGSTSVTRFNTVVTSDRKKGHDAGAVSNFSRPAGQQNPLGKAGGVQLGGARILQTQEITIR
ncbi:hypothetical protein GQ53DRAFT_701189, partial [Thozetella sp. PMI_491]